MVITFFAALTLLALAFPDTLNASPVNLTNVSELEKRDWDGIKIYQCSPSCGSDESMQGHTFSLSQLNPFKCYNTGGWSVLTDKYWDLVNHIDCGTSCGGNLAIQLYNKADCRGNVTGGDDADENGFDVTSASESMLNA